jgi:zinc protease
MKSVNLLVVALLAPAALLPIPAASKPTRFADTISSRFAGIEIDIPSKKFVLNNGLNLIVHEDKSTPLVAVNIWYHVGSKNEPEGKSGFAHLFEHLMFNGSENFNDDFFKATQKLGASDQNGTTNNDRTNYFQTVPKASLDALLWLESDRMGHLQGAINQAKLDEQRAVVKNEKRQSQNNPYAEAQDLIIAGTTPTGHPYAHSTIGSMEDLDAASLDDVKKWFRDFYGPTNAVIVIAGDISPEEALGKVEKYFGDIPPGSPVPQSTSWVVKKTGTLRETAYVRAAEHVLIRTWNISDYRSADTDYLQYLAQILAGSRTSSLHKRLVIDEQLATAVDANVDNRELGGQFTISVTAKPGVDLKIVEQIVDEEVQKVIKIGPVVSEMTKARAASIAGIVRSLESIGGFSGKANLLAESETFLGSPDAWKVGWERYKAAKPKDLQAAAKRWLSDGDYVLHMIPVGQFSAASVGADRTKMPIPGEPVPAVFPVLERIQFANGLKLIVAQRPGAPLVSMSMLVNTGISSDWKNEAVGVGGFATGLMGEGTKQWTGNQLSDQLGALGASIDAAGSGEVSIISLSALKPMLREALDIYADVILHPAYRSADVERAKSASLAGLSAARQDGAQIAARIAPALLHGWDSPYGRIQNEIDIGSVNSAMLTDFHARWFKPNNSTLVIAGDTNLSEMRPLVEEAFGTWQQGAVPERISPTSPTATKAVVYLIDKPGAPQSSIRANVMAAKRIDGDIPARGVFTFAIGGGFTSRLNMKLREEKGWAYGASDSFEGGRGSRVYSAQASVQVDKTGEAMIEIRNLLESATGERKLTPKELADAKANLTLGLSSSWSKQSGIVDAITDQIAVGLPEDFYAGYPQAIKDVTLASANEAGAELLEKKALTWIVAGDLSEIETSIRALNLGEVRVIDSDGKIVR